MSNTWYCKLIAHSQQLHYSQDKTRQPHFSWSLVVFPRFVCVFDENSQVCELTLSSTRCRGCRRRLLYPPEPGCLRWPDSECQAEETETRGCHFLIFHRDENHTKLKGPSSRQTCGWDRCPDKMSARLYVKLNNKHNRDASASENDCRINKADCAASHAQLSDTVFWGNTKRVQRVNTISIWISVFQLCVWPLCYAISFLRNVYLLWGWRKSIHHDSVN